MKSSAFFPSYCKRAISRYRHRTRAREEPVEDGIWFTMYYGSKRHPEPPDWLVKLNKSATMVIYSNS